MCRKWDKRSVIGGKWDLVGREIFKFEKINFMLKIQRNFLDILIKFNQNQK